VRKPSGASPPEPSTRPGVDGERGAQRALAVDRQIEAARRRVTALLPTPDGPATNGSDPSGASLRDFSVALELVGVVADELQADNEELAAVLKSAQADLRHYRDLFLFAPGGGHLVTDANGTIVEANEASSELLRSSAGGLAGKRVDVFLNEDVPAGERGKLRTELARLRPGEQIHGWEVNVQPEGWPSFPATVDVSAARDAQGLVSGLHWQLHDISDRKLAEDRMEFKATHDWLTGLPNRATFQEHLSLAVARARRRDLAVAVLYLDLDDFKRINDSGGHAAGDEVLRQFGARLQRISRDTDLVARLGGDEFAILLSDLSRDEVDGSLATRGAARPTPPWVADRVEEALRPPFSVAGKDVILSASIGIGLFPTDASDERTVLESADAAMYRIKRAGFQTPRP
jgi:diguanylate cyclase (GGDEF)-like protein/PAS domain S-box-containing protein